MRGTLFITISAFILTLSFFLPAFSQEKKEIPACSSDACSPAKAPFPLEQEIIPLKNRLKEILVDRDVRLISYRAIKEKKLSLCGQAGDSNEACRQFVRYNLFLKRIVEKDCAQIDDLEIKELCLGIKEKDCSGLSGWKKDWCEGFLREDIELIKKALAASKDYLIEKTNFVNEKTNFKEMVETSMTMYLGFREGFAGCQKYQTQSLLDKFMCEIIFGDKKIEEILDRIAFDLAYFSRAKEIANPEICDKIKDQDIRNNCLDPKIKVLEGFWR